jgi:hypothetical protein
LQECKPSGEAWGECKCVVFDASFEAGFVEAGVADATPEHDAGDGPESGSQPSAGLADTGD